MLFIKIWVKTKIKQFIQSRFLLAIVCLTIGITYTYLALEAPKYYKENASIEIIINNSSDEINRSSNVEEISEESVMPQSNDNLVSSIVDYIHLKESSHGKNNYTACEKQNKYNEYGYGIPGNGTYLCYETQEENEQAVKEWVKKKIAAGFSEKELLCIYNKGLSYNGLCDYAEGFVI